MSVVVLDQSYRVGIVNKSTFKKNGRDRKIVVFTYTGALTRPTFYVLRTKKNTFRGRSLFWGVPPPPHWWLTGIFWKQLADFASPSPGYPAGGVGGVVGGARRFSGWNPPRQGEVVEGGSPGTLAPALS